LGHAAPRPDEETTTVGKRGCGTIAGRHGLSHDRSKTKLALVQKRARGSAHSHVIGKENVQRFFTIAAECGQAGVATKNF